MAPTAEKSTGTRVQTWLPITLAEQVGAEAELGVSKSTIYCAVESGA